jgi:GWxTD domain-containing protein
MTILEKWVGTPLAQALGWTLLHSLWEGAIVAAGLAAALLAARSARARYAAACVAMLVMLGGIGLTLVRLMPEEVHGLRSAGASGFPAWVAPTDMGVAAPSSSGLAAVVPWLAPFWMVGVWIFVLGQVTGWISVGRLRRRGVCYASEHWQKELVRLRARLRLSRPVLLLESCLADVPMVIGHIRPVILMPVGVLAGLPAGQIEAILLHELAHIHRYDYLVNIFQRSVECLLFYHPAVWWISRVMRAERENCCDDVVVATSGNVEEYAVALATLEQNRWSGREPAVAASGGSLVKRIRRLLYPNEANSIWTPLLAAIIVITTCVVALFGWPAKPLPQSSAPPTRQAGHAEKSAYDRWLSQEVPYIITDSERTAFKKLSTDEERDEFIKAFWERRNPHPGSPQNEFKDAYYRRISYANRHYTSSLPGWRTDRGRIYIMYGPPDEIDVHPSGGSYHRPASEGGGTVMTYPFEDWRYAHFQGIGSLTIEFVDVASSGEFHMTLDPKEKYKKP